MPEVTFASAATSRELGVAGLVRHVDAGDGPEERDGEQDRGERRRSRARGAEVRFGVVMGAPVRSGRAVRQASRSRCGPHHGARTCLDSGSALSTPGDAVTMTGERAAGGGAGGHLAARPVLLRGVPRLDACRGPARLLDRRWHVLLPGGDAGPYVVGHAAHLRAPSTARLGLPGTRHRLAWSAFAEEYARSRSAARPRPPRRRADGYLRRPSFVWWFVFLALGLHFTPAVRPLRAAAAIPC